MTGDESKPSGFSDIYSQLASLLKSDGVFHEHTVESEEPNMQIAGYEIGTDRDGNFTIYTVWVKRPDDE